MTESEWLECTDPMPMRVFLARQASRRKLLLFACASCRRILHLLTDARSVDALSVVEQYLEGVVRDEDLTHAHAQASMAWREADARCKGRRKRFEQAAVASVALAADAVVSVIAEAMRPEHELMVWYGLPERMATSQPNVAEAARIAAESKPETRYRGSILTTLAPAAVSEWVFQCHFIREIFGNPFRAVSINPIWLTPTVLNLAQAAYDERILPSGELEPARLAVLSDALEEAGCDDEDILGHLRSPGPHVRGCWAVDLLLGKE